MLHHAQVEFKCTKIIWEKWKATSWDLPDLPGCAGAGTEAKLVQLVMKFARNRSENWKESKLPNIFVHQQTQKHRVQLHQAIMCMFIQSCKSWGIWRCSSFFIQQGVSYRHSREIPILLKLANAAKAIEICTWECWLNYNVEQIPCKNNKKWYDKYDKKIWQTFHEVYLCFFHYELKRNPPGRAGLEVRSGTWNRHLSLRIWQRERAGIDNSRSVWLIFCWFIVGWLSSMNHIFLFYTDICQRLRHVTETSVSSHGPVPTGRHAEACLWCQAQGVKQKLFVSKDTVPIHQSLQVVTRYAPGTPRSFDRRKFRSQTSDSMDRWKEEQKVRREGESKEKVRKFKSERRESER